MDDAISTEVQWDKEGGRCLDLSRSLASINFQAMGERCKGEEPLLSQNGDRLGNTAGGVRVRYRYEEYDY